MHTMHSAKSEHALSVDGKNKQKCSFGEGTTKYHMYELYGWINHHTVDI